MRDLFHSATHIDWRPLSTCGLFRWRPFQHSGHAPWYKGWGGWRTVELTHNFLKGGGAGPSGPPGSAPDCPSRQDEEQEKKRQSRVKNLKKKNARYMYNLRKGRSIAFMLHSFLKTRHFCYKKKDVLSIHCFFISLPYFDPE